MALLGDVPEPYVAKFCEEGSWVFANTVRIQKPWDNVREDHGSWDGIGGCLKVDAFRQFIQSIRYHGGRENQGIEGGVAEGFK